MCVPFVPFTGITVGETKGWKSFTAHAECMETQLITFLASRSKSLFGGSIAASYGISLTESCRRTKQLNCGMNNCSVVEKCIFQNDIGKHIIFISNRMCWSWESVWTVDIRTMACIRGHFLLLVMLFTVVPYKHITQFLSVVNVFFSLICFTLQNDKNNQKH